MKTQEIIEFLKQNTNYYLERECFLGKEWWKLKNSVNLTTIPLKSISAISASKKLERIPYKKDEPIEIGIMKYKLKNNITDKI